MTHSALTVGLFGTCGGSQWRNSFMEAYEKAGIPYFNPQVDDWTPDLAEVEAWHLANDLVILFPITKETYAAGSLTEIGFSVLNAIKLDDRRDIVVMIEPELLPELMQDKERAKESLRSRALVKQHLLKQQLPNVYLVTNLEDMLEVSLHLYEAADIRQKHTARFSLKQART